MAVQAAGFGNSEHPRHPRSHPDRPGAARQPARPRRPQQYRAAGIRFRIPTGPAPSGNRPGSGTGVRNGSAPPPAPTPVPKPTPPTLQQQHARALDGPKRAQDRDTLGVWARGAEGFAFGERERDALEDAYQHRLERIEVAEVATAPRRRG